MGVERARAAAQPGLRSTVAAVLPDVAAVDRAFDYLVPEPLLKQVRLGTIVRIDLHGRRVRGWVIGLSEEEEVRSRWRLKPITKVTGEGPPPEVLSLTAWAAWRWAGPRSAFLQTASPLTSVRSLPPSASSAVRFRPEREASPAAALAADAFGCASRRAVVRLPPAADPFPLVLQAASRAPALVLTPSVATCRRLVGSLKDTGLPVAEYPSDWAAAAGGGHTVVGARGAAWAPVSHLRAVLVLDEHDEGYAEERAPTWHAREVAIERARRDEVPCVLVSPCPSLEALGWGTLFRFSRREEREGWPLVDIVDRRQDDPRSGLYSAPLVALLRSGRRVVCVLNRKGRARILACVDCGELARCERCGSAVDQEAVTLDCRRCGTKRPPVCLSCEGGRLKVLRAGVSRVREELERLAGVPVLEVSGESAQLGGEGLAQGQPAVIVGTEAVLHRVEGADVVAFLDFDQELLAPRFRAGDEALALLARAARLVGERTRGGRLLVQTRLPRHEVLLAALHADPSRLVATEALVRRQIGLPPEVALALVSGESAPGFVQGLTGVTVKGPSEGRWLVSAPDHQRLCDALAAATRPPGRLRIEVDPLRA